MVSDRSNGSNRGGGNSNLAGFGLLAALLLSCLIVGVLAYVSGSQNERRNQGPASYSQAAKADAQRACVGMETGASFECIYEKVKASQEQARGEQDLNAQQWSANAAVFSALIAMMTLILSGVGVWFVKRTLDATLEAVEDTGKATKAMETQNEIARESMENQLRPWLVIDSMSSPSMIIENGEPRIRFKFEIKNIGASPAISVQHVCWLCAGYEPHIGYDIAWSLYRKEMLAFSGDLFPNQQASVDARIGPNSNDCKGGVGNIVIAIFYKTIWSETLRETTQFYQMFHDRESFIDFECPLSSKELKLLPWEERPGIIS